VGSVLPSRWPEEQGIHPGVESTRSTHSRPASHGRYTAQVKLSTMQAIDELQDVTDDQLAELLDSFKMEKFEQGQTVIAQGEPGCKLHILLKGRAEV
jgi:CRP-like cAMP-binding protein